jgi:hypothetical protein
MMNMIKGLLKLVDRLVKVWGYVSLLGISVIALGAKFGIGCDHELLQCKSKNPPQYCGLCKYLTDEYNKSKDKSDQDNH